MEEINPRTKQFGGNLSLTLLFSYSPLMFVDANDMLKKLQGTLERERLNCKGGKEDVP